MEGPFLPGQKEDDGQLLCEYVLVDDTWAVEFNHATDGVSNPFSITSHLTHSLEITSQPQQPLHDQNIPPTPSTDYYPPEYPIPTNNNGTNNVNTTFWLPPNIFAPPLSSPSGMASWAASNTLNRALSIASKKLFGHFSSGHSCTSQEIKAVRCHCLDGHRLSCWRDKGTGIRSRMICYLALEI